MAVRFARHAPVDQVNVKSAIEQPSHDAAIVFQIQNVRAVDQRETDQNRFGEFDRVIGIPQQFQGPFFVNNLARRCPLG